MTRALLCALLLLTACQKKDPEGTVTLKGDAGKLGMFGAETVVSGDFSPLRVPEAGRYQFLMFTPAKFEEKQGCVTEMTLRKHGSADVLRTGTLAPGASFPAWDLEAGLYTVSLNARSGACPYNLVISQQ
jgi:hypothetical protein